MGGNTKLGRVPEGARRQWAADRALRPPMRSPGRPEPSRAVQREFWRLIATGITTVEAALEVGVSWPVGARWFRHAGGMPPISLDEPSGRYLSFAEREEIALLRAQGKGVREIGRSIGRDVGTISRELRRNAATGAGKQEYRAVVAQWKAQQTAKRPKTAKLVSNPRLREYVQERLSGSVRRPDGVVVAGPEPPLKAKPRATTSSRGFALMQQRSVYNFPRPNSLSLPLIACSAPKDWLRCSIGSALCRRTRRNHASTCGDFWA